MKTIGYLWVTVLLVVIAGCKERPKVMTSNRPLKANIAPDTAANSEADTSRILIIGPIEVDISKEKKCPDCFYKPGAVINIDTFYAKALFKDSLMLSTGDLRKLKSEKQFELSVLTDTNIIRLFHPIKKYDDGRLLEFGAAYRSIVKTKFGYALAFYLYDDWGQHITLVHTDSKGNFIVGLVVTDGWGDMGISFGHKTNIGNDTLQVLAYQTYAGWVEDVPNPPTTGSIDETNSWYKITETGDIKLVRQRVEKTRVVTEPEMIAYWKTLDN